MAQQLYRCIRQCYFGKGETVRGKAPPKRVYHVGESEVFDPEKETIPRHFVPAIKYTDVPEVQPQKGILKGFRAPLDRDQLAEAERLRLAKASPVDAIKAEAPDFLPTPPAPEPPPETDAGSPEWDEPPVGMPAGADEPPVGSEETETARRRKGKPA